MWSIHATRDGKQLPTFYLDSTVQGITNEEHAVNIAREIIGNCIEIRNGRLETIVQISAYPV